MRRDGADVLAGTLAKAARLTMVDMPSGPRLRGLWTAPEELLRYGCRDAARGAALRLDACVRVWSRDAGRSASGNESGATSSLGMATSETQVAVSSGGAVRS
jgi:hypothetical protein